ncbi:hypothetical protein BO85DRAFT_235240 [Aspergillus piperis CBS 112811]|uniref:Uncharacterized protein n=1 Tax=Aspergillus piperis CBS 112811 TaxID=1448313 RepID=A0A8G1R8Q5_9EURO|nr:hypothetical protein BO85DRAFT_235240 [Aspergillus piperis CBS 112811]RAH60676.1 hypothetical protein BO85DRAFT_235240 [Aspergillus piperis CBS 112811]
MCTGLTQYVLLYLRTSFPNFSRISYHSNTESAAFRERSSLSKPIVNLSLAIGLHVVATRSTLPYTGSSDIFQCWRHSRCLPRRQKYTPATRDAKRSRLTEHCSSRYIIGLSSKACAIPQVHACRLPFKQWRWINVCAHIKRSMLLVAAESTKASCAITQSSRYRCLTGCSRLV